MLSVSYCCFNLTSLSLEVLKHHGKCPESVKQKVIALTHSLLQRERGPSNPAPSSK